MALDPREKLAKVTKAIGLNDAALAIARQRWQRQHKAAKRAYADFEAETEKATELRKRGQEAKAKRHEKRAHASKIASEAAANRAQRQVGVVKARTQRKLDLDATKQRLEARLAAAQRKNKVTVKGDKVTGGDARKRLRVGMLASAAACAGGRRHNFYAQGGTWDIDHCITGPPIGHRDDCSSWGTSLYRSCGLPDPNGQRYGNGWTGTQVAHGTPCSREYARNNAGCAIIFGDGPGHHVEYSIGDGTEHTIGHGSSPVDMGTFNLLPGTVRFFKFPLS